MAILTIAREYGSGGKEIGRAVAKLMGYRYVDRKQILEEMKKKGRQWEEKAKYYDENHPDIWERYDWSYRGFVALNQSYILNNALEGNVVIMGRGGSFLLKGIAFALRVRTTASLEKKIENVMRWEEEINSENAQYLIEKADSEMAGAVYLIYGSSWDDPTQYDMVFNTSVQTYEQIISIIKDELVRREQFNTEGQRKILNLRALAAKIKAEIATDPTVSISTINVLPKEEALVEYGLLLRGVVHNKDDIKRIEEIATKLAGNVSIECKLQYRWHPRFGAQQFR
jgi:cytidylate kinase